MLLLARSFGLGPVSRASMGHGFGHSRVLTAAVWSLFTTIATMNDPECESSTVSPAMLPMRSRSVPNTARCNRRRLLGKTFLFRIGPNGLVQNRTKCEDRSAKPCCPSCGCNSQQRSISSGHLAELCCPSCGRSEHQMLNA